MATGCAPHLFGVKPAGKAPVSAVGVNWKPGQATPAGYSPVKVRVDLRSLLGQSGRSVQDIPSVAGTPLGNSQVLLFVKKADTGAFVTDAFGSGTQAAYVAAVEPDGTAEFNLPPLPNSGVLNPTDPIDSTGSNAYRFEVRVYNRALGANAVVTPLDLFQHISVVPGADLDDLTNSKLIASGEVLGTVSPGLPIVVDVPLLYWHIGSNLDSHALTPTTKITSTDAPVNSGVVRVRATNVDTSKLSGNARATIKLTGTAAPTSIRVVNNAGQDVTVTSSAAPASLNAVAAELKTLLEGSALGANYNFSVSGATIKMAAKTNSDQFNGTISNASLYLDSENLDGGNPAVTGVKSKFTFTLSGTYQAGQRVDFEFNAGGSNYLLQNVATNTATLAALASEIANQLNTDVAFNTATNFNTTFTATAVGNTVEIEAQSNAAAKDLDATQPASFIVASLASSATASLDALDSPEEVLGPGGTSLRFYDRVVTFSGTPEKGDTFRITATKSDASATTTISYTANTGDTIDTVANALENEANSVNDTFKVNFTAVANNAANTLTFTAKNNPTGWTITNVEKIVDPVSVTASDSVDALGVVPVAATLVNAQVDVEPPGDDALASGQTVTVSITRGSATDTFSHTVGAAETSADVATALAALIDANANYVATAAGSVITITGQDGAPDIDEYATSTSLPISVKRVPSVGFDGNTTTIALSGGVASTFEHKLRVMLKYGAAQASPPTLSVTDGNRRDNDDIPNSLGKFLKQLGTSATVNNLATSLLSGSTATYFLDLSVPSGASAPTSGPWNFTVSGPTAAPTQFILMDLETAPSQDGPTTVEAE